MKKLLAGLVTISLLMSIILIPGTFVSAKDKESNIKTVVGPNGEVTTYEDLTYEEAMKRISKYSGKSLKQVKEENPEVSTLATCQYTDVTQILPVKTTFPAYKPKYYSVVRKCYEGSFQWVDIIQYSGLDRNYNGTVKQFQGDVKTWVSDNQQGIYYIVNGDFYELGDTYVSAEAGANTPIFSIKYSISSSLNYFKYYNSYTQYIPLTY